MSFRDKYHAAAAAVVIFSVLFGSSGETLAKRHNANSTSHTKVANSAGKSNKKVQTVAPEQGSKVSLSEALALAERYSLRVRIADKQLEQAQHAVGEAQAQAQPKIRIQAKSPDIRFPKGDVVRTAEELAQVGIQGSLRIYDSGRTKESTSQAKHLHRAAEFARRGEVELLHYTTVKAYIGSQRHQALTVEAKRYMKQAEALNDLIAERVRAGQASQSELTRGRLAITNARTRLKNAQLDLLRSRQEVASLVGHDMETVGLKRRAQLPAIDTKEIVARANRSNFGVLAREASVYAARSAREVTRSDGGPQLDLRASYNRSLQPIPSDISSTLNEGRVGLHLSWDLFDGSLKSRLAKAEAARGTAQLQHDLERREVKDLATGMATDAQLARQHWQLSGETNILARETRELYQDEFKIGSRSLSDLIAAETDTYLSSADRINAECDFILAIVGLYYLAGETQSGLRHLSLI